MLHVRPGQLGDLFWLRLLFGQFLAEHERPDSYPTMGPETGEAILTHMLPRIGTDPSLIFHVAHDGEVVVGFLVGELGMRPVGEPARFALAHFLFVTAAFRGQGAGRLLTAAGLAQARDLGCTHAELTAAPGDPQWAQRGWSPVGVVYALPLDGVAASLAAKADQAQA